MQPTTIHAESNTPVARETTSTVEATPLLRRRIARRKLMIASFWAGIGAVVAAIGGTIVNTLYPREVGVFGGPVGVTPELVPRPGEPPRPVLAGKFLLVHLEADEGRLSGDTTATPGGLLALYRKCPHLGCVVPWKGDFRLPTDDEQRRGWFRCPCHQSTYTKAGVLQFGPAPRSMDTMRVEVQDDGSLVVQTGEISQGDTDNPLRAVPYPPPPDA